MAAASADGAGLRLVTWNVNGLASLVEAPSSVSSGEQLAVLLQGLEADIVCLQETKAMRHTLAPALALPPGFEAFFAFSQSKRAYSGVATYCRVRVRGPDGEWRTTSRAIPVASSSSLLADLGPDDSGLQGANAAVLRELDGEGRYVCTDHGAFVLLNVYVPNASVGDERFECKVAFLRLLQRRIDSLHRGGRAVIVVGDLNVARQALDVSPALQSGRAEWDTPDASRAALERLLAEGGLVDTFRELHPAEAGAYTCWSTKLRCRAANIGARIDYVLLERSLFVHAAACELLRDVGGSDHAPVRLALAPAPAWAEPPEPRAPPRAAARYWPEFAGAQQRIPALFAARALSASAQPEASAERPSAAAGSVSTRAPSQPTAAKRTRSAPSIQHYFSRPAADPPAAAADPPAAAAAAAVAEPEVSASASAASAEAVRSQWRALLPGKREPPRCRGHGLPASLLTTAKRGPNQGRAFYICPLPIDSRCKFFLWASEFKGD